MRTNRAIVGASILLGLSAANCQVLIELREYVVVEETGSPSGTGGSGGSGGGGGSGGSGGATGIVCLPLEQKECYTGPAGTLGIGTCRPGTSVCNIAGTAFGPCEGEVVPENERPDEIGDEGCDGYLPGEPIWWRTFGNEQDQWSESIAADKLGNVYVCGSFEGTLQFDETPALVSQGGTDIFLVKLSSNGEAEWSKRFGNWENQVGCHLAADDSGVTVAGTWEGEIYFGGAILGGDFVDSYAARFGESGDHIWSRPAALFIDQELKGITNLPGGDSVLVGSVHNVHQDGGTGAFASRLAAADGMTSWSKLISNDAYPDQVGDQTGLDISSSDNGDIAVIGHFDVPQYGKGISIYRLETTGALMGHREYPLSENGTDCYVQEDLRIALGPSLEQFITGSFWCTLLLEGFALEGPIDPLGGGGDIFWAKAESNGTVAWAQHYKWSNDLQGPLHLSGDAVGSVAVAAHTETSIDFGGGKSGPATGGGNIVFSKVTAAGGHLWTQSFPGGFQEHARVMALPDGSTAFVESFTSRIVVGLTAEMSAGARDVIVGKLAP